MPQGAASVACRERRSDGRRRAETGQGQRQGEEQGKRHSRRLGTTHDNFLNLCALMSSKIDGQESEERERERKRGEERASRNRNFFHFPDGMCVLRVKVFPIADVRTKESSQTERKRARERETQRQSTTTMTLQRCK